MKTINERGKKMENRIIELLKERIRFNFEVMRIAEEVGDIAIVSDYVTQIETLLDVYENAKEFDFGLRIAFNRETSRHELQKIEEW